MSLRWLIGVISLHDKESEHAYPESAVSLLSTLAARAGIALQNARLFEAQYDLVDAVERLSRVTVPTLVLHRRSDPLVPLDCGREIAMGIPNSKLVVIDGGCNHYALDGSQAIIDAVVRFADAAG